MADIIADNINRKMQELIHRFGYHPPKTPTKIQDHEDVRAHACSLAIEFERMLPEGREKAVAMTKIEEAMFWANAAIARN